MGQTLPSHENLVNVRGWSFDQIATVFDTLRRKNMVYTLTKDDYSRYIGGRNREAISVFNDLDTDYDGKVDIFEVLVTLTIWSGTSWEEKQDLLFMFFDMMDKEFLKIDEVMLMGTVIVQTMTKFVKIDAHYGMIPYLKELSQEAYPAGEDKLTLINFRTFSNSVDPFEHLRGFIEDQAARGQRSSVESRMRLQISTLEKHVEKLFERLERLQSRLPNFVESCIEYVSAYGRRKRWDFVMQNLRQLVLNLHQCAENMHTSLVDLSASLKEDEVNQGLTSVIEPHRRFKQEQMVLEVEQMRQQSLGDFREATDLLRRLIEFTEPHEALNTSLADQVDMSSMNVINEEEHEQMVDMSPPRVVESRKTMKQVHGEMLAEIGEGGAFSRDTEGFQALVEQGGGTDQPAALALSSTPEDIMGGGNIPTLVAIANFDPPETHQTQMLQLSVGDVVTVIGQDGKGWWYGKKQNGKEGWFPPSYVQTKGAHYSSAKGLSAPLD